MKINKFNKVNTSKVQDSKPARARYIVNPVTGQYESTAYIPPVKTPTPKAKPMKILDYIDGFKNNDPKVYKAMSDHSDQLHYDSVRGQFKKGDKVGALSDFKNDEKLFEPILDRLKVKGKRTQTPIQKKSISREIIKNFKPIELPNDDIAKELQDVRNRSQRSAELEQQYQQLIKLRVDPDLTSKIASILKPKRSR